MKVLEVPFLGGAEDDLQAISLLMAGQPLHAIDNNPWPEFKTTAKAGFSIAHNNSAILIRYEVEEEELKSSSRDFNQNVHKDNCVEFFIAFGNGKAYYNIELNCLGSLKIGYGPGRGDRLVIKPEFLKQVKINTSINYTPNSGTDALKWQLLLSLPAAVFSQDHIAAFGGLMGKANFYKCGDDLPNPHFLSWNMINADSPDFHRPEFFGELHFR
ncbi:carbohydrate-binding family 9-like protein [Pedobacter nyackensis]|uniref:Carbohydrate-binding family 9 n=1 Tax=Pedobacter nyackensis TaxID=475255 RepID=A0A1W2EXL5_9SPHI|nr:carbohydrate-binding family 9-like protein [Pedobacter nyackensis]SMD14447.1 Carbohydrate-binding family 9 [Pedobacter nyackensis]